MHELLVSLQVMVMEICRGLSQQSSGKRLNMPALNWQGQLMQIKGPLMDQKSGKKREKDWFQRSDLIPFASDLGEKKM